MSNVCVTGAGGFIGHHLVKRLVAEGHHVRGVDIKYPDFEPSAAHEFILADQRYYHHAEEAVRDMDDVYALAADMGGIGYITAYLANIARNNTSINLNTLEAAREHGVKRYLFTSSACVYNQDKQQSNTAKALKEEDAYPALPEPGYGWEKLYAEQMVQYYQHDYKLDARIVRFHNVYGPLGTYDGGKEKAPAAICRKVARAKDGDTLEIWGDGRQTRSFMYIDDCVEGLRQIMESSYPLPLNLGTDELVYIDDLFDRVAFLAGKKIHKLHDISKPQGVRGRNSDNTRLRQILGWEPRIMLWEGLEPTYKWIAEQVKKEKKC